MLVSHHVSESEAGTICWLKAGEERCSYKQPNKKLLSHIEKFFFSPKANHQGTEIKWTCTIKSTTTTVKIFYPEIQQKRDLNENIFVAWVKSSPWQPHISLSKVKQMKDGLGHKKTNNHIDEKYAPLPMWNKVIVHRRKSVQFMHVLRPMYRSCTFCLCCYVMKSA